MNNPQRYDLPHLTIALVSCLISLSLLLTAAHAEEPREMYEMEILGVAATQGGDQTAILLRGKGEKRELTLFVGSLEAQGIAVPLQQVKLPRPLTHDLMLSLLTTLHSRLLRVVISDVKDNTYYATLHIETGDKKEMTVDSRPSDAIALALRAGVPIYAAHKALDGAPADRSPK